MINVSSRLNRPVFDRVLLTFERESPYKPRNQIIGQTDLDE